MSSSVGIGIIGAGFMGMLHARALSQLADVHVLAACDPALKRAPKLPGRSEPLRLYSDHRKLLDNPDIQAVVIASPESPHRQAVGSVRCLEPGPVAPIPVLPQHGNGVIGKLLDLGHVQKH